MHRALSPHSEDGTQGNPNSEEGWGITINAHLRAYQSSTYSRLTKSKHVTKWDLNSSGEGNNFLPTIRATAYWQSCCTIERLLGSWSSIPFTWVYRFLNKTPSRGVRQSNHNINFLILKYWLVQSSKTT